MKHGGNGRGEGRTPGSKELARTEFQGEKRGCRVKKGFLFHDKGFFDTAGGRGGTAAGRTSARERRRRMRPRRPRSGVGRARRGDLRSTTFEFRKTDVGASAIRTREAGARGVDRWLCGGLSA